jgi:hypothetical protein
MQYLNVWRDAAVLLGGPLLGVGLVCWVLTASLWGATLLLVVLTSLLVHLMGAMLIAGGCVSVKCAITSQARAKYLKRSGLQMAQPGTHCSATM